MQCWPPEHTRNQLAPVALPDDHDKTGDRHTNGSFDSPNVAISNFPPRDSGPHPPSRSVAAYAGDKQAVQLVRRPVARQTSSAGSPFDSMPLDPFGSLPLQLSNADQKVLLSCECVAQSPKER